MIAAKLADASWITAGALAVATITTYLLGPAEKDGAMKQTRLVVVVLATKPVRLSRGGAIVMVKPAEHRYADNSRRTSAPFEYALYRNSLPNSLVRPCDVEIPKAILIEHLTEVPFAEDDDVIKTLAPDASEKSLANGIHEGSLNGRPSTPVDSGATHNFPYVNAMLTAP